jgi:hypothetical protein
VTLSKEVDGLDLIYSFSIINQDFDGAGGYNDSLAWDIRIEGFANGQVTCNGNDSSVNLGNEAQVHGSTYYFGVGSDFYVNQDESIQFSIENVVMTAGANSTVEFNGFDGIFGIANSYIFGVGSSGLESKVITENADFTFPPLTTLTLSCSGEKFRIRDLSGSFTITSSR